ncbi:MAG: DNA-binding response regulator, partial [Sulfurovum sp.]
MKILIIDDNQEILFGLEKLLTKSNFKTYTASNLKEAKKTLEQYEYDLIILDWMLPDGSGVDFLAQMRKEFYTTSVLLLSSKQDIEDKVEALDSGADDYLSKPFSNIELLARIRALLRRESSYKKSLIEIKNLKVDLASYQVTVDNKPIELTKKEFELLELLVLNQHVVLTRYQINDHINHDFNSLKSSNLVDVHIKNLRKKLGLASTLIET